MKGSRDLIFIIFGPPSIYISGTVEARNLKVGKDVDHKRH